MTVYSQKGYPKRVILNGDTVIAISQEQQKSILKVYEQRDMLKSVINGLEKHKHSDSLYIAQLKGYIAELNNIIELYKSKDRNNQTIIESQKAIIKQCDKQIKKLKFKSAFAIAGASGGGLMIGIGVGILYEMFK